MCVNERNHPKQHKIRATGDFFPCCSLRLWLLPLEQAVGTQEMAGPLFPLGERLG